MNDIFLSHSHRDAARIELVLEQLRSWGLSVYCDLTDSGLSALPDRELATRLKEQLEQCHLMVFAFSEGAANSRWMPWELGLAHGRIGRVVLWPLTPKALKAKATQEYLHLYEALDPEQPQVRLRALVNEARRSAVRPADIAIMGDLGKVLAGQIENIGDPGVAMEFGLWGPMRLYFAWWNAVTEAVKKR